MLLLEYRRLPISGGRPSRALQSEEGICLLRDMLTAAGLPHPPIERDEAGRPFFGGCDDMDFSIAHTDTLVACAILLQPHARVGVDAEPITHSPARVARISRGFFSIAEQQYLADATDPARAFAEAFTRKEAYAKYCGDGLLRHIKEDTLSPDFAATRGVIFTACIAEGHCITACRRA
ncbi:MAG: 4'-phosphopantetheinyl transferase superfamily protein [Ruminococcaceae bacterium]|nr:4'-phosphopantetheinyl transferase superfamily protein [Oscillospiraceae bacterium]